MPEAFASDDVLAPLLADRASAAVLLDVDGTLAPIVRDPEAATVPERMRRLVQRLTEEFAVVGCISGRRSTEARRMVGIGTIPYAGNHGAELLVRGAPEPAVDPEVAAWAGRVHAIAEGVDEERRRACGLRIEDKGPVVGLHWRGADDETAAEQLAEELAGAAEAAGLAVHRGRRVLELRPPVAFGKDAAVRLLLGDAPVSAALYVGDDRTDADAFAGLRGLVAEGRLAHAVCIAVRSDETPAELLRDADAAVDGPDGVRDLLTRLIA